MDGESSSVLDRIKENYEELFSAEKRVAEFILENPQEMIMMNISELAQKSGSSEATVVRMCKHVGYQGYHQMRIVLSHDLGKTRGTYDDSEMLSTAQHLFDSSAARVAALGETINMEQLIDVAKLLKASRMVYIVAAGNTTPVASDLGFRLERYGIPCSYAILPEQFLNHVSHGTTEDTIIAISRSGDSKSVVQAMELARKKRMKSIVISGEKNTQMAESADCVLQITDKKKKKTVTELDSHLLEFAVSDAILHVVRYYECYVKDMTRNEGCVNDGDDVELLLSEYKL